MKKYFDHGVLMVAMVKAGVELAFETMVDAGIIEESAYYESLHELPLIANTIARKRLYEMNVVILRYRGVRQPPVRQRGGAVAERLRDHSAGGRFGQKPWRVRRWTTRNCAT